MTTNNIKQIRQYMSLRSISLLCIYITLTMLSGCNDSDKEQISTVNQVETQLIQNSGSQSTTLTSKNISQNVQDAPYTFTQTFNRLDNGQYEKLHELRYDFSAKNKEYTIDVNYKDLNQNPISVNFNRYLIDKNGTKTIEESFFCEKDYFPCIGFTLQLDPQKGHSLLKLQNAQFQSNESKMTLNGELSGVLAFTPYQVNIKPQPNYQLDFSLDSKFIDLQNIPKTHYSTLKFINHNKIFLSTSSNALIQTMDEIDIYILDNKISTVSFFGGWNNPHLTWSQDKTAQLSQVSYDPKTYIVKFNALILENQLMTPLPLYLKGSIGP